VIEKQFGHHVRDFAEEALASIAIERWNTSPRSDDELERLRNFSIVFARG
jgi:citrate lyase gamma subunit